MQPKVNEIYFLTSGTRIAQSKVIKICCCSTGFVCPSIRTAVRATLGTSTCTSVQRCMCSTLACMAVVPADLYNIRGPEPRFQHNARQRRTARDPNEQQGRLQVYTCVRMYL